MDATIPKYSKARYQEIVEEASLYSKKVGYNPEKIAFVPIFGFEGDNLIERSTNFDWYEGPTLLDAIDHIQKLETPSARRLRLPFTKKKRSLSFSHFRMFTRFMVVWRLS